jgi:type IV pilus assembly protein PilV
MTAMPHFRSRCAPVLQPTRRLQQGVFLLEALLGILIFSLGILSLVAMQTAAVSAQSDAQYRIEASNLGNEILGRIWLNVDRTSPATVQASLAGFQHQATGAASTCNFSGAASVATQITTWVDKVTGAAGLPGATDTMQQIVVNTVAGGYNQVSVTLCWKAPVDANPHRHTVVSFIN